MRYSQLFGKTTYGEQKDIALKSHQYLLKGGFIRESVAGRYFFLPLGMKVVSKIIGIIRDQMDLSGAQEMVSPILHPLELWQETNRDQAGNFGLMQVDDRRGAKFALGGTAEEMFVDVVRKFQISYRDLPFNLYQFSQKFRDELRARGGLLRVREFTMKDAYSFDRGPEEFITTYQKMADTYTQIFDRLGLKTHMVEADNGYIGGEYCHEFIVDSPAGESRYLVSQTNDYFAHEDVAKFKLEPLNPDEAILDLETIDQPEWVHTMEDNQKHYGKPSWHFLKNVVYKNIIDNSLVIAVIRGDLDVNKTKLEKVIGAVEQLEEATAEDLANIGTKPGYVHSWGHAGVTYIADLSLRTVKNFIGGQKEETKDTQNVNYGRDFTADIEADIAMAKDGMQTADGSSRLNEANGIEVGNIFQLGYHYTEKMKGANYTDETGALKPLYMGCYGIGVGRTMAAIVETHHDERGIIWPDSVAPYQVYLISLKGAEDRGEAIHQELLNAGIEVLWDDRDESPGAKFSDADLIGLPVRLVVSPRTGDQVEWKRRYSQETELLDLAEVITRLKP